MFFEKRRSLRHKELLVFLGLLLVPFGRASPYLGLNGGLATFSGGYLGLEVGATDLGQPFGFGQLGVRAKAGFYNLEFAKYDLAVDLLTGREFGSLGFYGFLGLDFVGGVDPDVRLFPVHGGVLVHYWVDPSVAVSLEVGAAVATFKAAPLVVPRTGFTLGVAYRW